MPAIVREQREAMSQGCGADEEIEVADRGPRCPQSAAFLGEYPADLIVHLSNPDSGKELLESTLVATGVLREEYTLVELGHRHDAESNALWRQLVQAGGYALYTVQAMDYPVGVQEVPHGGLDPRFRPRLDETV